MQFIQIAFEFQLNFQKMRAEQIIFIFSINIKGTEKYILNPTAALNETFPLSGYSYLMSQSLYGRWYFFFFKNKVP